MTRSHPDHGIPASATGALRPGAASRAGRLRALGFSPIVTGALLALVWFSAPVGLWGVLFASASSTATGSAPSPSDVARSYFAGHGLVGAAATTAFNAVVASSWRAGVNNQRALFSSLDSATVRPLAWPPASPMISPLADFERASGSRVFAWVLQPIPRPPVVVQAVPDESLLHTAEQLQNAQASTESDFLWQTWHQLGSQQPVEWTSYPTHFVASRDAIRNIGVNVGRGTDAWWLVYVITPYQDATQPDDTMLPSALDPPNPRSAAWMRTANAIASERGMDILALGPLQLDAVPLRVPAGVSLTTATELGRQIWPNDRRLYAQSGSAGPVPLTSAESSIADGSQATVRVKGVFENRELKFDDSVGQSIMYAAVTGRPSAGSRAGSLGTRESFLVAAAPNMLFALALAIVLFVVSLFASVGSLVAVALQRPQAPEAR